jgi:hypothetical protein
MWMLRPLHLLLVAAVSAYAAEPPLDIAKRVAERETASEAERGNYTYRQTVLFEEFKRNGRKGGNYRETREVIFSPTGERTERPVERPTNTLQLLRLTDEDFSDIRDIQPLLLTKDRLFLYRVRPKGEETVDGVDCWVLDVQPRQILDGQRLFEGLFWVDKRDYSIVRSQGKAVPQLLSSKPGNDNLFPGFTTVREKIGEFWFPVHTHADDVLPFTAGPLRVRLTIRYLNYQKFGAESKVVIAPE